MQGNILLRNGSISFASAFNTHPSLEGAEELKSPTVNLTLRCSVHWVCNALSKKKVIKNQNVLI